MMTKKEQIKGILRFFAKPLVQWGRSKRIRENSRYYSYVKNKPIRKNEFLLESYHAVSTTGNVYSIFEKLIEKNPTGKYYWVVKDLDNPMNSWLKKLSTNVSIIKYESKTYYKLLATCEYLINDTSFMPYFVKREDQIYINTWHGTPLKTLGKDIKNSSAHGHKNIQRNLMQTDLLLMPNLFTAERLLQSHDLDGIFKGKVFLTGNARVDKNWSISSKIRKKYNLPIDKKIILFAPTWKKSIAQTTDSDIQNLLTEVNTIQENVSSDYIVLLKAHYFIYEKFLKLGYENKIIPNWVDTNELLSTVDRLITDYSSIFFDFLPLKKPIYFLIPDKDNYERTRGFYLDIDSLPGVVSTTLDGIIKKIKLTDKEYLAEYETNISNYIENFCSLDDGKASERSVDVILNRNVEKIENPTFDSKKEIILLYGGGFYSNGITSSLINLSKNLDYSKYELMVLESDYMPAGKKGNLEKLDPRARIVFKFSNPFKTLLSSYNQEMYYRQGYDSKYYSKNMFTQDIDWEIKRLLGNIKPDIGIDFGGYNKAFNSLIAFGSFKRKSVFLHSLMLEEYNKVVKNRYIHKWNLKVIFSAYNLFDNIISVSESANLQNKKELAQFDVSPSKMNYINNVIDGEGILLNEVAYQNINNGREIYSTIDHQLRIPYSETINNFGVQTITAIITPKKEDINFVTVARLSPEKNHLTLIKAFKKVSEQYANAKLFLVGSGVLANEIKNCIQELDLENSVYMYGYLSNPIPIISMCDCLVSPSNYEGQGLVLMEAMIVKRAVIGTDVIGNQSVLKEYPDSLVTNTVEGLSDGMINFIEGKIQVNDFDYIKYNQEALNKFYSLVC